jgi:hypothetical protein
MKPQGSLSRQKETTKSYSVKLKPGKAFAFILYKNLLSLELERPISGVRKQVEQFFIKNKLQVRCFGTYLHSFL